MSDDYDRSLYKDLMELVECVEAIIEEILILQDRISKLEDKNFSKIKKIPKGKAK